MIKSIVNGKEVKMEKMSIVGTLSGANVDKITGILEALLTIDELKKVQGFEEDCKYIRENLPNQEKTDKYSEARDRILRAVRNHGIPRRGHLDDTAKKLIEKFRGEYRRLLDDASIAESFGVVLAHYGEGEHNPRYEAHLNHLNGAIINARSTDTRKSQARYGLAKLV